MKKSKTITLLFVTSLLTVSANAQTPAEGPQKQRLFVRSDTTQKYTHAHTTGIGTGFFVFRAFGAMRNGQYMRQGYTNPARPNSVPMGNGTVSRGGFGRSMSVSS
jgi:uncharacterized protein YgiB involved in biofilm formation